MAEFIRLTVPAGAGASAAAQAVAASLGLQLHMSVDRLDDLRLALDEALAEVVAACPDAAEVHCEFAVDATGIEVRLQAQTSTEQLPDHHGLGWTVLRAITGRVHAFVDAGRLHLHLSVASDSPSGAVPAPGAADQAR